MKNPAMRPELSLLSRFQGGTHIRPHGLGLTLPLCVGRYRQIIWRCRLAASRFSQSAACSGAPSHRPSLGSGTTQTFKVRLQQGFAPGEMGFNDKFALQKILNGPCPLWVVLQFRARAGFAASFSAVGDACSREPN